MRIPLTVAALVPLIATGSAAQDDRDVRNARFQLFNNCQPIYLIVETLSEDADIGLTDERIQTMAETRLRAARIYDDTVTVPNVYVQVAVFRTSFRFDITFRKGLYDSVSSEQSLAITWIDGSMGIHGGDAGYIVRGVSEHMDAFILEYLRVNADACE